MLRALHKHASRPLCRYLSVNNRKLFALALAGLAAGSTFLYVRSVEREARGGKIVRTVVVRRGLAAGARLSDDLVALRDVPERYVHPESIVASSVGDYLGRPLQHALQAGQPILRTDIANQAASASQPLSQMIPKGLRGFAIPLGSRSAMGSLLSSGCRVDVLGTFARDGSGERKTVTLLQNVTVVAAGSRNASGSREDETRRRETRIDQVTLAVRLEDAALLAFAIERGELQLVLRNDEDVQMLEGVPERTLADIFEPAARNRSPSKASAPAIETLRAIRTR